jgi:hypothetical protein
MVVSFFLGRVIDKGVTSTSFEGFLLLIEQVRIRGEINVFFWGG